MTAGTPDLDQLRHLLFGKDYDDLLVLKEQFESSDKYTASVAAIISEALRLRSHQDNSLSAALSPLMEQTLHQSIQNEPRRIADVLYPIMGPAIRKSIQQALNEMLENINYVLEQSFSLRAWRWRFDAWRTGQSYARIALLRTLVYQVEQVFLIHRNSGLLLHHVVAEKAITKDPEIVSGMLTAIQDFIKDSFSIDGDDTLDTLKLGEMTVLVEYGPHAITALVVRGKPPAELRSLLTETSDTIHQQYTRQFKNFKGDTGAFASTDTLLRQCLKSQQQTPGKRSPWLAYTLLTTIAAAVAWWSYQYYQEKAELAARRAKAEHTQQAMLQDLQTQLSKQQTETEAARTSLKNLLNQQRQQADEQARQTADLQHSIQQLSGMIEAAKYPFEHAIADVDISNPALKQLAGNIRQLQQAAQRNDQSIQIMIIGNTDGTGTETINRQLAHDRAHNIRDTLIRIGVPAAILVAYDANQPGLPASARKSERGVIYKVGLY